MKVIIIGTKMGSCCLAHGLLRSGIEVKIFEPETRDSPVQSRYGLHIDSFGQRALQECLPPKNWQSFLSRGAPVVGRNQCFDERLRLLPDINGFRWDGGRPINESRLSISRAELRDLSVHGLSGEDGGRSIIEWAKVFERYEMRHDGRVEVFFQDGTQDTADVLVGADGINSRLRKQLLPDLEIVRAKVTAIVGRTELGSADSLPYELLDGTPNMIASRAGDSIFVTTLRAPTDATVRIAAAEIAPFVVWAYIVADDALPRAVAEFSQKELLELAMQRSQRFDASLWVTMFNCEVESISLVPLMTMKELPLWKASSVTLIGDAVHTMPAVADLAANTALRDACLLRDTLVAAATGRTNLTDAISQYENQMRLYANVAIAQSVRNAEDAVKRSPLRQLFFRAQRSIAETFPALKPKIFPPGM